MAFLRVIEDGTTHSLELLASGGVRYVIEHEGVRDPIIGRLDRYRALSVIDDLDAACCEGIAELLECDDETLARFRWG